MYTGSVSSLRNIFSGGDCCCFLCSNCRAKLPNSPVFKMGKALVDEGTIIVITSTGKGEALFYSPFLVVLTLIRSPLFSVKRTLPLTHDEDVFRGTFSGPPTFCLIFSHNSKCHMSYLCYL